jgi:aquaglyceroporin related protein, other eukaryote
MIAPFFGCVFGGWLYDCFLFTGESPCNTPWMGLHRLAPPDWNAVRAELMGADPETLAEKMA